METLLLCNFALVSINSPKKIANSFFVDVRLPGKTRYGRVYQTRICAAFSQYRRHQNKQAEGLYSLKQIRGGFSSAVPCYSWKLKKRFIQIFLATTSGQSPRKRSNVSSLNDRSGSGPVCLRTVITGLLTMHRLMPKPMSPLIEILQRVFSTGLVVVLSGPRENVGVPKFGKGSGCPGGYMYWYLSCLRDICFSTCVLI